MEMVRARASSFVLALAGIKPDEASSSINVNIEVRAGYVIDIREPEERPRMIEHE